MDSTFRRTPDIHLQDLIDGLLSGNRAFLSKAITLVESKKAEHKKLSAELVNAVIQHEKESFRIGITGVPGVGKSTFIEAFGKMLTSKGKKVAVLSIDPSSNRTKGSILGDKTRMDELSRDPNAYIRPSASGATLGGVASNTRESILLCEAAGYDVVIIETVGVGQSETVVKDMVDYFLLLMLAGGGDELQGIKRGIMEMADHILINKADKDNLKAAKKAREDYKNAVHLFPPNDAEWTVPVGLCSAIEKTGIDDAWNEIDNYAQHTQMNGWFNENRRRQAIKWFHERVRARLEEDFYSKPNIKEEIKKREELISSQKISVRKAVDELFS
ncbi:methylmalonyl-CoA mutase metallochaperone MeaB [Ekhidna lutea]|uniref:Methylmalonyl-CoA mutase metallochaperone MeaB n=1 Tax=Ekhidna lutea TaxID=447679 RepID=A0A239KFN6_EKHLU|nr:methylmalonyl Co-A mutase-associated GTPase MeaB [Ekhidna lutea]SNT15944.1 methylmalonyl-CoA mutase metallochaperone MeaB [Ekhidna lutea]